MVYEEVEQTRQTQLNTAPMETIQPVLLRIRDLAAGY